MEPADITLGAYTYQYDGSGQLVSTSGPFTQYREVITQASRPGDHKSPTPYSYSVEKNYALHGTLSQYSAHGLIARYAGYYGGSEWDALRLQYVDSLESFEALDSKAVLQLWDNVQSGPSLLQDIGEYKATRAMIDGRAVTTAPLKSYIRTPSGAKKQIWIAGLDYARYRSLTALAARQFSRFERLVRELRPSRWADGWLAYNYGAKPLIMDMYETARVIAGMGSNTSIWVEGKAISGASGVTRVSWRGSAMKIARVAFVTKRGVLYRIRFAPQDNILASISNSLGGLNPISLAYDLTRLSFVIDWFYNIGGTLHALEAALLNRQRFIEGSRYDLQKIDVNLQVDGDHSTDGQYFSTSQASAEYRQRFGLRTVLSEAPLPTFPRISIDMGGSRWLSAAALLQTLFWRKF